MTQYEDLLDYQCGYWCYHYDALNGERSYCQLHIPLPVLCMCATFLGPPDGHLLFRGHHSLMRIVHRLSVRRAVCLAVGFYLLALT
ncbi:unnamed protein product [Gongylonema pulchrum]|uniref:Transmembrane protein n=1 Tax=Gongylonema pulchrum TaxID=637853 RepID=A0A183EJV9_9BILA|nr:unnamed protein product [Gongylonema pulchrum]